MGIGANTAIFSLINAVLLKMLPVKGPAQLVVVGDPLQAHSTSVGTPQLDYFSYPPIGILIGIPAALLSSRLFSSMLFGLKGTDPASMTIVILMLCVVALFASYVPARRATKVDPMVALRNE